MIGTVRRLECSQQSVSLHHTGKKDNYIGVIPHFVLRLETRRWNKRDGGNGRERERERERERDRETERQRDRETERQTETERITCYFTPRQSVRLYQRERDRQTDRQIIFIAYCLLKAEPKSRKAYTEACIWTRY